MFLHSILSIFKWNTLYLHLILEKMNECRLSLVLGKREIIFADVVKTVKSDQSCLNTPSPPPQWIHDFFRIVFTGCLKKWNWFHEKKIRPWDPFINEAGTLLPTIFLGAYFSRYSNSEPYESILLCNEIKKIYCIIIFLLQFCIHRNSLYRVISNQIEEKIVKSYLHFNNFTKFSNWLQICIIKEELNKHAYLNVTNEYEPPCRITTWKFWYGQGCRPKADGFFIIFMHLDLLHLPSFINFLVKKYRILHFITKAFWHRITACI